MNSIYSDSEFELIDTIRDNNISKNINDDVNSNEDVNNDEDNNDDQQENNSEENEHINILSSTVTEIIKNQQVEELQVKLTEIEKTNDNYIKVIQQKDQHIVNQEE